MERKAREARKDKVGLASSAGFAFLLYLALTIALTWPLVTGLAHDLPGDFGDPLFTSWVLAWDATHLGRGWWSANIFAASAVAGVLRALSAAGAPGAADLRGDEEPDPLLQPALPLDVHAVGPRHVSPRPRADRKHGRGDGLGARVRVRAVSHRVDPSPAGAVGCLDAVRAVRPPAAFRDRPIAAARRRRRRVAGAEPVVRLLPPLLQPHRHPLHRLGADDARVVERHADASSPSHRDCNGARGHRAVPAAVPRTGAARLQPAVAV